MKKKTHLNNFVFDLRVTGSRNGVTVTAPLVAQRASSISMFLKEDVETPTFEVTMDSTVCTSKEEILAAISTALDSFYE